MISLHSTDYKKITLGLGLGSFMVFCNLYYFQPLLPYFMQKFALSELQVNWLFSSTSLTIALSLLPWAIVSEVYGRRPVMCLSLLLIPCINLLMYINQDFYSLVLLRASLGVALAGFIAVAVAYMAEEFEPQAVLIAVGGYIGANTLGGISGRIYGGVMTDSVGLDLTILMMSILSFIVLVSILPLILPQRHFVSQKGQLSKQIKLALQHITAAKTGFAMLIGGLNFAIFINVYSIMTFKLAVAPISLPASVISLIFLCYLSGTLSARLSGRWLQRRSVFDGIFWGVGVCIFGLVIMSLQTLSAILVGLIVLSAGAFFIHSLAYGYVGRTAKEGKSTATALYLVLYYAGGSIGGFGLIYCWQVGGWPLVLVAAALIYCMMLLLTQGLKTVNRSQLPLHSV